MVLRLARKNVYIIGVKSGIMKKMPPMISLTIKAMCEESLKTKQYPPYRIKVIQEISQNPILHAVMPEL